MAVQPQAAAALSAGAVSNGWRAARRERRAAAQERRRVAALDTASRRARHDAATAWHANRTLAGAVAAAEILADFAAAHRDGDPETIRAGHAALEHEGLYWVRAMREATDLGLPADEVAVLGERARSALLQATRSNERGVVARAQYLLTCVHLRLHDVAAAEDGLQMVLRLAVHHPFTKAQLERLQDAVTALRQGAAEAA